MSNDFEAAFREARDLHQAGNLVAAEKAYGVLSQNPAVQEQAYQALAELYMQSNRPAMAGQTWLRLTEIRPDEMSYYVQVANLLEHMGDIDAAIAQYDRLIERQPQLAAAYFNKAIIYKRSLRYQPALQAYEKALSLDIDNSEEVYSNMGVIHSELHQPDEARHMYQRALECNAGYVPALFNLAGLQEEAGDADASIKLYRHILKIAPTHWESLTRLANIGKKTDADDPIFAELLAGIDQAKDSPAELEGLYFALGKTLDDVASYQQALEAYDKANVIAGQRSQYQPDLEEKSTAKLKQLFTAERLAAMRSDSDVSPIMICGMFRSGSTLLEQMLGAHSAVTAGGELPFMPWVLGQHLSRKQVSDVTAQDTRAMGDQYQARIDELFPAARHVTDKRPENFRHLGLIVSMFPKARIVFTHRNRLDNCLSVYFQRMSAQLGYATDLADTNHYYRLHIELMDYWKSLFPDNIFSVDYDQLVQQPEPILRDLLKFLGLEWDKNCLDFSRSDTVQTASIWQVREGLHTGSSGRWEKYREFIPHAATLESE